MFSIKIREQSMWCVPKLYWILVQGTETPERWVFLHRKLSLPSTTSLCVLFSIQWHPNLLVYLFWELNHIIFRMQNPSLRPEVGD